MPGMMGSVETVGDLGCVLERLTERYRPLGKPVGERFAVEKLHDQVVDAIVTTDVMHCADVRMIAARDRARFILEPFTPSRIAAGVAGDDLDRDGAIGRVSVAGTPPPCRQRQEPTRSHTGRAATAAQGA